MKVRAVLLLDKSMVSGCPAHPGVHHAPRGGGEVCRGKVGQEWGWMRFSTRIALSPVLHIGFLHNIVCKEKFPLRKKKFENFYHENNS